MRNAREKSPRLPADATRGTSRPACASARWSRLGSPRPRPLKAREDGPRRCTRTLPEPHGLVATAGREEVPAGGPGAAFHLVLVAFQCAHDFVILTVCTNIHIE
jgi:hypothetical protein